MDSGSRYCTNNPRNNNTLSKNPTRESCKVSGVARNFQITESNNPGKKTKGATTITKSPPIAPAPIAPEAKAVFANKKTYAPRQHALFQ